MRFSTRAIHVGQEADPATGATIPPIHLSTTFTQAGVGGHKGYEYQRSGNPTRASLEECLASLEGGAHGLAFASGLAAETAILSLLAPGERVVAAEDLYGGTIRLFERVFRPYGVEFAYVDGTDTAAFARAAEAGARMLWVETPSNPLLRITDISAVAEVARASGALLVVDNTFATPYLQRPFELGADIVVHSTTKYIGGHSDVIGGAIVVNDDALRERLAFYQNAAGGVPGPFESWLTLRGVKTLAVRMDAHCRNAAAVAKLLAGSSKVEAVFFPGLPDHPEHELAARQMSGFGGMVSLRLAGGRAAAERFFAALRLFSLAESLGGVESLACYPCAMTHASIPEEERTRRGVDEGLIRLSVGIEDAEDVLDDIARALEQV